MFDRKSVLSGICILTGMCFSLLPSVAFADIVLMSPEKMRALQMELFLSHFVPLVLSWLGLIGVLMLIALFVTVLVRYGIYRYRKFNLMDVSYVDDYDTHWFSKVCASLGSVVVSIVGLIVVLCFVLSPVHFKYGDTYFDVSDGEPKCDSRMITPMTALVKFNGTLNQGRTISRSVYAYVTVFDHIRYHFFPQIEIEDVRNDAIGGAVLEKEPANVLYEEHSDSWYSE